MRRTVTTLSMAALAVAGLSACGDSGDEDLTQAQTAEALLTQEDFPLEGYTRGSVTERAADAGTQTADPDDSLAALMEDADVPEECLTALEATDFGGSATTAESSVPFISETEGALITPEIEVVVGTAAGDSPLDLLNEVNDACADVEVTDANMGFTMTFSSLDNLDGTKITVAIADQTVEMTMAGKTEGNTIVAVLGQGVTQEDVETVVNAQVDKVNALAEG